MTGSSVLPITHSNDKDKKKKKGSLLIFALLVVLLSLFNSAGTGRDYNPRALEQSSPHHSTPDQIEGNRELLSVAPESEMVQEKEPVHILFGLSGNAEGFFGEFEVALKSVLLNGPIHAPLEVHIMADGLAHEKLVQDVWPRLFLNHNEAQNDNANTIETDTFQDPYDSSIIKTSKRNTTTSSLPWYTNVTITAYNVESHQEEWRKLIQKSTGKNIADSGHTIGTFYRLLAHLVLPPRVRTVFYMDTDLVFFANYAQVFYAHHNNPKDWFIQMQGTCAGLMLVNVPRLPAFWEIVSQMDWSNHGTNDQELALGVREKYDQNHTNLVLDLPDAWNLVVTDHWMGHKKTETVVKFRPELGVVHYNGGGSGKESYWIGGAFAKRNSEITGWNIACTYYVDLPWSWAYFMGKTLGYGHTDDNTRIRISDYSSSKADTSIISKEVELIDEKRQKMQEAAGQNDYVVAGRLQEEVKRLEELQRVMQEASQQKHG